MQQCIQDVLRQRVVTLQNLYLMPTYVHIRKLQPLRKLATFIKRSKRWKSKDNRRTPERERCREDEEWMMKEHNTSYHSIDVVPEDTTQRTRVPGKSPRPIMPCKNLHATCKGRAALFRPQGSKSHHHQPWVNRANMFEFSPISLPLHRQPQHQNHWEMLDAVYATLPIPA